MLTIGSQIPDLSGKNQFGEEVSLRAHLGTQTAIYFYPKDDTPGCTAKNSVPSTPYHSPLFPIQTELL